MVATHVLLPSSCPQLTYYYADTYSCQLHLSVKKYIRELLALAGASKMPTKRAVAMGNYELRWSAAPTPMARWWTLAGVPRGGAVGLVRVAGEVLPGHVLRPHGGAAALPARLQG